MKFFLLAHVGTLVVLVAGTCEFEELQNNLTAFNVRLTSANTSGARPSSVEFTSLCRELLATDGIFRKCRHSKKREISILLRKVKPKFNEYCNKGCNGYLDLTECINDVDGTDNNGSANCNRYFEILRGCVNKTQWCELRDELFLSSLPAGFRESLHEAGCVPRPVDEKYNKNLANLSDPSESLTDWNDFGTECPNHKHALWCAGILQTVTGPLSQMCRYYDAALKCIRCPLAHTLLLQVLEGKPTPVWLDVCRSDCPDLLLALLSIEFCADMYNWTAASNNTCLQVWGVTSCLTNHQVEDLKCNIGHVLEMVIPGLPSAQAGCASMSTPTTSSSTTTTTSTTNMASTTTTSQMTTPSTTTGTTTPTIASTATTTLIAHTLSDLMVLRNAVLQTCPPDNLTAQQPQEGFSQHSGTSSHSLPMNISSCLHLLKFQECLSKLPACSGSSQHSHCIASLPEHLQTLVRKHEWCLQLVYRAAADMEIIKTGQHGEGYKGFTNFTCTKDAGVSRNGERPVILLALLCIAWLIKLG